MAFGIVGPFEETMHRDEFLEGLTKRMKDAALIETSKRKKEELRCLVRRYLKLDEQSGEGVAIAEQVYANTGYYLGPMTKQVPKFSADPVYRKKTLEKLTAYLNRANQEWRDADSQRELHTKAKHSRNENGLFEYTDTVTGTRISVRDYEQRYLEYTKAHEVDPVLHIFTDQKHEVQQGKVPENIAASSAQRSEPSELGTKASLLFMTTLGIDISSSCVIDKDFFGSRATPMTTEKLAYNGEDSSFRAAVDDAQKSYWNSWANTFDQTSRDCASQAGQIRARNQPRSTAGVAGTNLCCCFFCAYSNVVLPIVSLSNAYACTREAT